MKRCLSQIIFLGTFWGGLTAADHFEIEVVDPLARTFSEQSFYKTSYMKKLRESGREISARIPPFSQLKTNLATGKNLCRVKKDGRLVALVGIDATECEGVYKLNLYADAASLQPKDRQQLFQEVYSFALDIMGAAKVAVVIRKRRLSLASGSISESSE